MSSTTRSGTMTVYSALAHDTFLDDQPTIGDRLADIVAAFTGSWPGIFSIIAAVGIWLLCNTFLPARDRVDPPPYILLNLILSCLATLQAPAILMAQNRQEDKDRLRSRQHYEATLRVEAKIDLLLAARTLNP